jgi:hypothetical protein
MFVKTLKKLPPLTPPKEGDKAHPNLPPRGRNNHGINSDICSLNKYPN